MKVTKYKPLYAQIRDHFIDMIRSGALEPDARIASENEICREFNVSKATAIRVLTELSALGYVRREQGKGSFVTGRTIRAGTLRLLYYRRTNEFSFNPYYSSMLGAVEESASEYRYDLILSSIRDKIDPASFNDAGFIFIGPVPEAHIRRMVDARLPVVVVEHPTFSLPVDKVFFDEIGSGRAAAKLLIERGFSRIGYLGEYDHLQPGRPEWPNSVLRREGVRQALKDAGRVLKDEHVLSGILPEEFERQLVAAMAAGPLPDAYVAFSETEITCFRKAFRNVAPENDEPFYATFGALHLKNLYSGCALVVGDMRQLGIEAMKLLMERIENPSGIPHEVILKRDVAV